MWLLVLFFLGATPAWAKDLVELSANPFNVRIGRHFGVTAGQVANELTQFEQTLQRAVHRLDQLLPPGTELDTDTTLARLDLCA